MILSELIIYFGYVYIYLMVREFVDNVVDYKTDYKKYFEHITHCLKCGTFQLSLPFLINYPLFIMFGYAGLISLFAEIINIYVENKF